MNPDQIQNEFLYEISGQQKKLHRISLKNKLYGNSIENQPLSIHGILRFEADQINVYGNFFMKLTRDLFKKRKEKKRKKKRKEKKRKEKKRERKKERQIERQKKRKGERKERKEHK